MPDGRPPGEPPRSSSRHRRAWAACANCHAWFGALVAEIRKGGGRYCSRACVGAAALAEGKFKGERNPRWLGGVSSDNMRYRRRQKERWPEREAARRAAYNAVRRGELERQPCSRCGASPAEGHHEDYARPLDVVWLCRPCHNAEHHRGEAP